MIDGSRPSLISVAFEVQSGRLSQCTERGKTSHDENKRGEHSGRLQWRLTLLWCKIVLMITACTYMLTRVQRGDAAVLSPVKIVFRSGSSYQCEDRNSSVVLRTEIVPSTVCWRWPANVSDDLFNPENDDGESLQLRTSCTSASTMSLQLFWGSEWCSVGDIPHFMQMHNSVSLLEACLPMLLRGDEENGFFSFDCSGTKYMQLV